jgi:hypothetical protein
MFLSNENVPPSHVDTPYQRKRFMLDGKPIRVMSNIWLYRNWMFSHILELKYIEAYREIDIKVDEIDDRYAIFPHSLYEKIQQINVPKSIDYCFIGQRNANNIQFHSRRWVEDFVIQHFNPQSYLQFNGAILEYKRKGDFDYTNIVHGVIARYDTSYDDNYFRIMKQSKFCLCPAGDESWSMRFYEAIMCKCIPIIKHDWETYRTQSEAILDYKFYYADNFEFVYHEDWVHHNYDIFLTYHTLKYYGSDKCVHKIEKI